MKIELVILTLMLLIATSVAIGSVSFEQPEPYEPDASAAYRASEYVEAIPKASPCFKEHEMGQLCTVLIMEEEVIEVW